MKKIALVLLFPLSFYSQMEDWYKADLGTLGYKRNIASFEKRDPTYAQPGYTNTNIDYSDSAWIKFKGGSTDLAVDIFTKYVYFHMDASIVTDLTIVFFTGIENKTENWYKKPDLGRYDQSKFLPMRLGFGHNITRYFNAYAGVQWQYSFYSYKPSNNVKYEASYIGGHQYGLGVHGTFAYGPILIRQSYMKDWLARASTYKGMAHTYETAIYGGYSIAGIFVKFNYQTMKMYPGTFSEKYESHFKSSLNNRMREYKEQNFKYVSYSIGVYAAGLFSGINKASSAAVSDTQIKDRIEKNQKKRTTIEWKE